MLTKRLARLCILVPLLVLLAPAVARGEVVQELSYQIKDIEPFGGFTFVFDVRSYDTTGAPPPPLRKSVLRLPAGAKIRREFLTKRFLCDVDKLDQTKDPRVCRNAEVGRGTVLVDARPFVTEPIPANIHLFLAKGAEKSSVASIAILGVPDDSAAVVKGNPIIKESKVVLRASFFNDPTPDGRFGYKLVLPTGPVRGVDIGIAEVHATIPGLTLKKRERSCVKRARGGCVKRKTKTRKLYWFDVPKCPPSRKFSFEAIFGYAGLPETARTITVPCANYRR